MMVSLTWISSLVLFTCLNYSAGYIVPESIQDSKNDSENTEDKVDEVQNSGELSGELSPWRFLDKSPNTTLEGESTSDDKEIIFSTAGNINYADSTYLGLDGSDTSVIWGCNFETRCTYVFRIEADGDYDWFLNKGQTNSSGTGPRGDHTTGSGYYLYAEATEATEGSEAFLVTSPSEISDSDFYCLDLWYHMRGVDMGEFLILYKNRSTNGTNTATIIFRKQGSQGEQWLHVEESFRTSVGEAFVVLFLAIRGSWYRGDIAVDDIKITRGRCTSLGQWADWASWSVCSKHCDGGIETRTRPCIKGTFCNGEGSEERRCNSHTCPADGSQMWGCDFESLCLDFASHWRNREYTWRLTKDETVTDGTGPASDHTTGTGYYVYAGASEGQTNDIAAYMSIPAKQSTSEYYCYSMWYHMKGRDVGQFEVYYANVNNTNETTTLFKKSGNLGEMWHQFEADFRTTVGSHFVVLLLASRGNGYQGDIAVDDLQVTQGRCESSIDTTHLTLSEWSHWSACGVTCGKGTTSRSRTCMPSPCRGTVTHQTKECQRTKCPRTRMSCGRAGPYLIIGGALSEDGRWPWQVGLYINLGGIFGGFAQFCGASIIDSQYLLTAAHCLVLPQGRRLISLNVSSTVAIMGSNDARSGGTRYKIKRFIPHPAFIYASAMNDIALIELESAIEFTNVVMPVCLPTHRPRTSQKCYVTGWGKTGTSQFSQVSRYLKEAEQKIQSEAWCLSKYRGQTGTTFQPASHFCAGPKLRTDVSGKGDSGGPFSCPEQDGYHIQGIVSVGSPAEDRPTAYTDVYRFIDWIKTTIL